MTNSLTLYNVEYVRGGITMPYFKTESSRATYFSNRPSRVINDLNPNIAMKKNLEYEIVATVDFTVAEDYNFIVIQYNGKTYFADILDYEMVSVGRTRLYCARNICYEIPDFFTYFSNFKIKKTTFTKYEYGNNPNYYVPDTLRSYIDRRPMNLYSVSKNGGLGKATMLVNFLVFYIEERNDNPFVCGNCPTNFSVMITPLAAGRYRTLGDKVYDYIGDYRNITEIIKEFSVNPLGIEVITLPLAVSPNGEFLIPFVENGVELSTNTFLLQISETNSAYWYDDIEIQNAVFNKLEYYFFNTENKLEINCKDYANANNILYMHLRFYYVLDPSNSSLYVELVDIPNSMHGKAVNKFVYRLNGSIKYYIDQEKAWLAQNKYYDVVTQANVDNMETQKQVNSNTQAITGAFEFFSSLATLSLSGMSLGIGNISRGVGTIITGNSEIERYETERSAEAKQGMESPSQGAGSNGGFSNIFFNEGIVCLIWRPTQKALEDYNGDLNIYGVDTYTEEDVFNFNNHIVDNHFFIKAVAVVNENAQSQLTTKELEFISNLLNDGCRFAVI